MTEPIILGYGKNSVSLLYSDSSDTADLQNSNIKFTLKIYYPSIIINDRDLPQRQQNVLEVIKIKNNGFCHPNIICFDNGYLINPNENDYNQLLSIIYQYDKNINGHPILYGLLTEYIPGNTINELIIHQSYPNLIYKLLDNMLSALYFLHTNGIVHNNINGDNVIFNDEDNKFVLIDFSNAIYFFDTNIYSSEMLNFKQLLERDIYHLGLLAYKLGTGLSFPYRNKEIRKDEYLIYPMDRKIGYFIDLLILEYNRPISEIYKIWNYKKIHIIS